MDTKKSKPFVSVVMSVYNDVDTVGETIESILKQTFEDFEFIIIDDGSTDGSIEVVQRYEDRRIILLENEINRGLIFSLNRGISNASGKYIARIDADSIAVVDRLQKQFDFLEANPNIGLISNWVIVNYEGQSTPVFIQAPTKNEDLQQHLLYKSCICHASAFFRHALWLEVGGYRNYLHAEDLDLWLRMAEKAELANLPEYLISYKAKTSSISSKYRFQQLTMLRTIWQEAMARRLAGAGVQPLPETLVRHYFTIALIFLLEGEIELFQKNIKELEHYKGNICKNNLFFQRQLIEFGPGDERKDLIPLFFDNTDDQKDIFTTIKRPTYSLYYISEAFRLNQLGRRDSVLKNLVYGCFLDIKWVFNKGVLSLLARSILKAASL